jgi:S-DNA-T family DNA segregation ATPase FtsK/SpoIIIE
VRNSIGPVGAYLADLLFFWFGRPAYLLPLMLAVSCWLLFRRRSQPVVAGSRLNAVVRVAGFILTLLASCGLASLHWLPGELRQSAGGVTGLLVGHGLAGGLQVLGATLFLIAAWMSGVALAFHVSWLQVADGIGHGFWFAVAWVRAWFGKRRDVEVGKEARRSRETQRAAAPKKAVERPVTVIEPPPPTVRKSERSEKERQVTLFDAAGGGQLPPLNLLDDPPPHVVSYSPEALESLSRLVEIKLRDFGVEVEVVAVYPGPVVTRFEMRPAPGVKVSQISSLAKDLARSLSAISVRVVVTSSGSCKP